MIKDDILRLLMKSGTGYVSGGDLAKRFMLSRTMVWKHIKALQDEGVKIEAVPSKGYRLMSMPDRLIKSEIERGLKKGIIGKEIHLMEEAVSTNTLAMEMAAKGAPEGAVVMAETQTGGKGRLGRRWISPKGNIHLSVILRPAVPTNKAPLITLMGAVATASAVNKECGVRAAIKWPNDITISGKKAGGLLTEMSAEPDRIKHIVLGIGLNVNAPLDDLPAEIRPLTTTLSREAGGNIDRTLLVRRMLGELERCYQAFLKNEALILDEWRSLNMTMGKRVAVSGAGGRLEGAAQDIDNEGRLILKLDDGSTRTVAAGDVTILKGSRVS